MVACTVAYLLVNIITFCRLAAATAGRDPTHDHLDTFPALLERMSLLLNAHLSRVPSSSYGALILGLNLNMLRLVIHIFLSVSESTFLCISHLYLRFEVRYLKPPQRSPRRPRILKATDMSSKRGTSFDSTLSQRVKRKKVAALWKRVAVPGMGGMWPFVEACAKLLAPSFTVCVLGCVAQHRLM